jgi:SH3-like domain-containing protein
VIVRAERAQVRAAADDKAALVFEAERDVVLELVEAAPGGWVKVRHRDGQGGFLKVPQVWGL